MNKKLTIGIIILALATIITVSVYQVSRESVPRSVLSVSYADNKTVVDPFRLKEIDVKGTVTNAKGESKDISSKGFRLIDAVKLANVPEEGYSTVKVISDDEYAAELTAAEAKDEEKTFLVIDENKDTKAKTLRLIVFGDKDSKRQVKNVARLELIK